MRIRFSRASLRHIKAHEYLTRFLLGGLLSLLTGVIARHYGPSIAGLFLAFPVLFPASATLVESHERQKKQRAGIATTHRGRLAAAIDARGAALGSLGLAAFALWAAFGLPRYAPGAALAIALLLWLLVSVTAWRVRERAIHWWWLLRGSRSKGA